MIPIRSIWYLARLLLKNLLLFAAILYGAGCLLVPWAMPIPGRETLSGYWSGRMESTHGPAATLLLTLDLKPSVAGAWTYTFDSSQYHSTAGARLQGQARVCTPRLGHTMLDMQGYTTAWSGKTMRILVTAKQAGHLKPRLDLKGSWDGTVLTVAEEGNNLDEALGEPGKGGNNTHDWIRAELRKIEADEWLAGCADKG